MNSTGYSIIDTSMSTDLLKICSQKMGATLPQTYEQTLQQWHKQTFKTPSLFQKKLLATEPAEWDWMISNHKANTHEWYDYIGDAIDIDTMASFLLENAYYPTFLDMLQKIRDAQFIDEAINAVQENIDDEFEPEPHANLMRKLMLAIKSRATEPIKLDAYPAINDRTLVFYYGYYLQPWHLVGSVFATEQMGTRRVICMKKGLERLGLTPEELAFTTVHAECDEHHADDWLQRVIIPGIKARPELRTMIVSGIAECLETSVIYLDYLLDRAQVGIV